MFDRHLLPLQHRLLVAPASRLLRLGLTADRLTLAGFAVGLAAVPALATRHFHLALGCILLNRLLDGLDGAVARLARPTDRGAFMDIALDFVFYALVPFGFALADPGRNALAAAALLVAFVGTGSSFLAIAAIAGRRGLQATDYPRKGLYYIGGLTEGTETIAVFVAMAVWPAVFPALAFFYAALCGLTTMTRWWWGWRLFST